MATPSVEQLGALLAGLTQPDTNTIRQAEAQLKPLLKNPATMTVLWAIVVDHNSPPGVRHVGAIVLRKRFPGHYNGFDAPSKLNWQHQILQALAQETVRPVRTGLVGVAAAIAQAEGKATDPFLHFLSSASQASDESARELVFLLLNEMTDVVGMHWKEHLPALQQLYAATLQTPTPSPMVQKAAVQSLGQLLSFWADEPQIEELSGLLPVLLQVASQYWQDEDFLAAVLEVLYELAMAPSLLTHTPVTIEFCLQCLQQRTLEVRVRDAAALVIATTAETKPKALGRSEPLLGAILDTLFQLMQDSSESAAGALFESNPAWREDLEGHDGADDDDDMDSPTETSMAQGTLDMLACELPKKYLWPAASQRCFSRMSNQQDPSARKAGVAGLGVIAEGCSEPLTAALPQVMPHVLAAAQDPSPQVRECACFALGQISEHCQPDVLQYNSQILPVVFQLLDDGSVAVQATSCYVLEMFCERLEPSAVRPFLDSLVHKLAAMLGATSKRSVQEMAVAALAATAVAAEEEFTPYVQGVASLMLPLMQIQDEKLFSLRGRALECMGHIAIAVGSDTFRPYFAPTMQCAMEGLTTDSTDLQEFAYAVFANLAKVMKEEFAPVIPDLVPHLLQVINMDEGQLEQAAQNDAAGDFGGLDDSDEEGDENGNYVLHVRTALVEVKKGAMTALGEMASYSGTSFCPFIEASMEALQKLAQNHWHPMVKAEAASAFPSLIVPSIAAYHNGTIEWKKGDLNSQSTLSPHTSAIVQAVLTELVELCNDEMKETVSKACESLQAVIELCGPQALVPIANSVLAITHGILSKTAPCLAEDVMYGEVPDEDDDHDTISQSACDLVGGMCRVMGSHFQPYLNEFLPVICEYAKSSRPSSDRAMSIGCLSEIAQELEGAIVEHWKPVFLPATIAALGDEDENVKRNGAFCVGICCEHLRETAAGDYHTILGALGPIFGLDATGNDSIAACLDNAAAAVARMIMASPNNVPMAQVLPAFLSALPLKTDMTENETVYNCLIGLIGMKQPDLMAHKAELQRIFTEACGDDSEVDEEIQTKLKEAAPSLQ